MLIFAFVVNPIIVYAKLRRNPYPLVWKCISTSGVTAFFTRSSAANIPVNMALAKELGIDPIRIRSPFPRGYYQYVRCGHHHFHHDLGGRSYLGYRR